MSSYRERRLIKLWRFSLFNRANQKSLQVIKLSPIPVYIKVVLLFASIVGPKKIAALTKLFALESTRLNNDDIAVSSVDATQLLARWAVLVHCRRLAGAVAAMLRMPRYIC